MKEAHDWARPYLESFARDLLEHTRANSIRPASDIMRIETQIYVAPSRFERERDQLFKRLPLMLAASCELSEPGQYKTIEVIGISVLLLRDTSGDARAYLNSCPHRGMQVADGEGKRNQFTCPYHGWTFSQSGDLVGVPLREEFGDLEDIRLTSFPVYENAGLIWVTLNAEPALSPSIFLAGFDRLLEVFDLTQWEFLQRRFIPGPNWKLTFEAHLEFYHLPVLHKDTFGPDTSNKALYYFWGPHQRLTQAKDSKEGVRDENNLFKLGIDKDGSWPLPSMMLGEWIIFPNVSINIFYQGGLGMLISQVVPGKTVDQSVTIQTYLLANESTDEARAEAENLCDFLQHVGTDEDMPTSARQQTTMRSGMLREVLIGKNEAGIQEFHRWIDRILETPDTELNQLFKIEPGWQ